MNIFKNFYICRHQKLQTRGCKSQNLKKLHRSKGVEHLPRPAGSRILLALSLYFSGVINLRDNKDTPVFVMESNFEYGLVTM